MIPVVVFWTKYTARRRGTVAKFVPCENCSTEYVYLLEREATGVGTSVYLTNEEGAEAHASSAADDTLEAYLTNDFDPVPCPSCGHIQRFMFPKLREGKWPWLQFGLLALTVIGCMNSATALYLSFRYVQRPDGQYLENMITAWVMLLPVCLIGFCLAWIRRVKESQFDPNLVDQDSRIATGRSRAITRAEFDAAKLAAAQRGPGESN